jgi:hypothetical protein
VRDDNGLHVTLKPGEKETGWRTPQAVRFGGDFTLTADFIVKTLPKPAQEDGVAVGVAIAFGDINQPDLALVRVREPTGADVYRSIPKPGGGPQQPQQMGMRMRFVQQGPNQNPGAKAHRPTFPAAGETIHLALRREGNNLHFEVTDARSKKPRYLGQAPLGNNDVAAVKLFVANRNGAEAVDATLRNLTIRAERVNGLGTIVRTVLNTTVYGDPTAIEKGELVIGGPPQTPPGAPGPPPGEAPAQPAAGANKVETAAVAVSVLPENPFAADGVKPAVTPPQPPKPRATIPLTDLESIRYERTPAMTGRFVGQPNLDFTGPHPGAKPAEPKEPEKGAAAKEKDRKPEAADDVLAPPPGTIAAAKVAKVEPKPSGIRDLHLTLAGLREAEVKQVTVNCQTEKGPTAWRLDTTDSQDWPLVLRRSATEPWADLFLEPPPADCHQKDFTIAVTYADGQNANVSVKATEHSDPKRAIDPKAAAIAPLGARVYLAGDEVLFGTVEGLGEAALRLTTPWGDRLDVPLTRVRGIHFALLGRKEPADSFARRLKSRGAEDQLLARTKDGEVLAIAGLLEGTEGDRLRFRYQGRTRTIPLDVVEGLVLAARPEPKAPDDLRELFSLPGGLAIRGRWTGLDAAAWTVETAWGQPLKLPAGDIQSVRFQGGRMTYLSDLMPSRVDEAPFFGRRLPWRRDVGLLGDALKVGGQTYERGVAVHSRSILTYDLNGRYITFEALLAFDDAGHGKGRVACRVLADGKELYANPDLRADNPPVPLKLAVTGAEQLRLEVDYGREQDTGDRVIWANARLFRATKP